LGLTPGGLQVCSGCTSGYISKALRYLKTIDWQHAHLIKKS